MEPVGNKGVVSLVVSSGGVSDKPADDYYFAFQCSSPWIEFILFLPEPIESVYLSIHVFPWQNWLWSSLFAGTLQVNLCEWLWSRGWSIYTTPLRHWTYTYFLFFSDKGFYHTSNAFAVFCWIERRFLCLDGVSESCESGINLFISSKVFVRQFIGCFISIEVPLLLKEHSHQHTNTGTQIFALFLCGCNVKAQMSFLWKSVFFCLTWISALH